MNPVNRARSLHSAANRPDPENMSRSEAVEATNSNAPDPQHHPRRHRSLGLLIVMALLLMGVGQAAFPVIDISSIAQLIEQVQIANDTLDQMTTARDALLGQVANFTGIWTDLTGEAYRLGERASSLTTDFSLTQLDSRLSSMRDADNLNWPTQSDVQDAYAGEDNAVIQQVLATHQLETNRRDETLNAHYDSMIAIAAAGRFLEDIESTSSTQNSETTQGLGAQLDRHIAVSSATRDIAAKQLELTTAAQHRAARLERLESDQQSEQKRRALLLRIEMQDAIADHEANFDAAAFDRSLYTPVLPSY